MTSYIFVPAMDLAYPPKGGLCEIRTDMFWLVHNGDLVFKVISPNHIQPLSSSIERVMNLAATEIPFSVEVKLVPSVFIGVTISETYRDGEYQGWNLIRRLNSGYVEKR